MKALDVWAKKARESDDHYIIVIGEESLSPVYCKDFDALHEMYHNLLEPGKTIQVASIIQVYHDGTYDVDLDIHNLH